MSNLPHKILSAFLDEASNTLTVVRQFPSNAAYCSGAPVPDRVTKEVYGVVDGRLELLRTVVGEHRPARVVPETVEFPE